LRNSSPNVIARSEATKQSLQSVVFIEIVSPPSPRLRSGQAGVRNDGVDILHNSINKGKQRKIMNDENTKINCSTFQKQEPVIRDISEKINNVKEVPKKAELAEKIQKEVDVLLSCPDYDENDLDCENCRFIASLRKKTAVLIMRANKLT